MKKIILIVLLAFATNSYCQELMDNETVYKFTEVDEKPDFEGGMEKFYKFVGKNFVAPEKSGLKGKTIIEFIIEKDGSLTNMKITQDIGYGTAEEVLRVFKLCPNWKPAKKNNQLVRTLFVFPITINVE
ncbi:energy transducer TonB [Flavobacterium sp. CHNK8]|uniref:energy transducer TonB n=1 Tax=Flavobacterium sp. CHNK8 TaxID=2871165 RepID=UPI001C8E3718|nr:energy transducer TonB [Flavobacterium sp. CHNK8]QZK91044.1 energy transducer TonB [Flavobacterium sp. CHNK8]